MSWRKLRQGWYVSECGQWTILDRGKSRWTLRGPDVDNVYISLKEAKSAAEQLYSVRPWTSNDLRDLIANIRSRPSRAKSSGRSATRPSGS